MTGELDESKIEELSKPIEAISEPAPDNPYTSAAIKEIVDKHVASIRSASLQLEGAVTIDIEYDNPEVHPQMMMDNLKDANVRLRVALLEIGRLISLTNERREQLAKTMKPNYGDQNKDE